MSTTDTATKAGSSYLPAGMPQPRPARDKLDGPYWAGALDGKLLVQRCKSCRGWQWSPEWVCYQCHSFDLGFEPVSGQGRIYAWERAWHPVHPALKEHGPYIVVLVELPDAGNVRMVGNLLGDPLQDIPIGAEVEAVFERHDEGEAPYALVQWRLV